MAASYRWNGAGQLLLHPFGLTCRFVLATLTESLTTLKLGIVSRGFGAMERRLLDAVIQRQEKDVYAYPGLIREHSTFTARWRWYTIDLLNLTEFGAPRGERVSLHRAVRSLHRARRLQIATKCPYEQPFGARQNAYDDYGDRDDDDYYYSDLYDTYVGGFDLSELHGVDSRWPHRQGRCLWFRLRPPPMEYVPGDDQTYVLDWIAEHESFIEFAETLDRTQAWKTSFASFLRWLFCGPPAS